METQVMIAIESQTPMKIFGEKLKPLFNASTLITTEIREWDLSKLNKILTINCFNHEEERISESYNRRRNSNTFLGAVLVGVLDAINGEDNIADGLFLGAVLGILFTRLRGKPKAQLSLNFSDGSHLEVEVNKNEYAQLQAITENNDCDNLNNNTLSYVDRELTLNEIDNILNGRGNKILRIGMFLASLFLFVLTLTMIFPIMSEKWDAGQPLLDIITSLWPYLCFELIIGTLIMFLFSKPSVIKTEELDYYKSLNQKNMFS